MAVNGFCQPGGYHLGPRDILTLSIYAGGLEQEKVEVTISEIAKRPPFFNTR